MTFEIAGNQLLDRCVCVYLISMTLITTMIFCAALRESFRQCRRVGYVSCLNSTASYIAFGIRILEFSTAVFYGRRKAVS